MKMRTERISGIPAPSYLLSAFYRIFIRFGNNLNLPALIPILKFLHPFGNGRNKTAQMPVNSRISIMIADIKHIPRTVSHPNTRNITIGKGTNAGLEEGMCAVTENGQVVGLVTKVGTNWATVTTIMDSSLEISASVASSGYKGVVQGTFLEDGTEILRMNYLLTDAIVKNNDQVVTTGSTLYPRGLLLGYLTNVGLDETGVAKYATLEASCDLANLEQIFIITQFSNQ